jgi:hypothetical protein
MSAHTHMHTHTHTHTHTHAHTHTHTHKHTHTHTSPHSNTLMYKLKQMYLPAMCAIRPGQPVRSQRIQKVLKDLRAKWWIQHELKAIWAISHYWDHWLDIVKDFSTGCTMVFQSGRNVRKWHSLGTVLKKCDLGVVEVGRRPSCTQESRCPCTVPLSCARSSWTHCGRRRGELNLAGAQWLFGAGFIGPRHGHPFLFSHDSDSYTAIIDWAIVTCFMERCPA